MLKTNIFWPSRRFVGIAAIVFIALSALAVHLTHQSHSPSARLPAGTITKTTSNPSQSKVAAQNYTWHGQGADPKQLVMPSIGVSAFVQDMGIDATGAIAAPTNLYLAGW